MGQLIDLSEYRKKKNRKLKGEITVADEYNALVFRVYGIKPGTTIKNITEPTDDGYATV
jgi:hypothetical protein